jgi:hypothetical protein
MLGGSSTVPPGITWQLPFTHMPLQAWLHPPQWTLLFITSTQAFEQSIWPAAEQPQTPALQTAPSGHGPQPPQWSAFPPFAGAQYPSEHWVSFVPQLVWQVLLLQTCPPAQAFVQPPQWVASEGTQLPPHESSPALHRHCPAWQLRPVPQALPQAPQFC